jgi:signal transduction histidine kinase
MGEGDIKIIIYGFNAFFILFVIGYVVFFRQYIIKKREYDTKIRLQNEEHKKELLNTQLEIQKQTMAHIGREIHDNLGQKLTLASINLQTLMLKKSDKDKKNLQNINEIIGGGLDLLRGLSKSLTDNHILELSFYELLNEEIEKINNINPFKINFIFDELIEFDYQQKVVLFRITQEFLQNSIKHANCQHVNIILNLDQNNINYTLSDDGNGFDIEKPTNKGIGLVNMKKRIELLNGKISITSEINEGTTINITLPFSHEKQISHS